MTAISPIPPTAAATIFVCRFMVDGIPNAMRVRVDIFMIQEFGGVYRQVLRYRAILLAARMPEIPPSAPTPVTHSTFITALRDLCAFLRAKFQSCIGVQVVLMAMWPHSMSWRNDAIPTCVTPTQGMPFRIIAGTFFSVISHVKQFWNVVQKDILMYQTALTVKSCKCFWIKIFIATTFTTKWRPF